MPGGSSRCAVDMATCTSWAAASRLRLRSNRIVICVIPCLLDELIELMPAMVENCCSSGVATAAAMVSGVEPGSEAVTTIVGKSTCGRSLTGSDR